MSEGARSTDRVRNAAAAVGLTIDIREMPQSTRTAAEAAEACGCVVAQIVKSLIFKKATSGEPVLLLVSGKNRVDEKAVKAAIGDTLVRIDAREVRDLTGFAIGGVAPLGSIRPLETYLDVDLLAYETVWAAAGAPHAVFEVVPTSLAEATSAKIITIG
jgi:prolyl-tRNA editing enzyme YbaK/EbsC (Cys-tRNA(Pro) deacylase)